MINSDRKTSDLLAPKLDIPDLARAKSVSSTTDETNLLQSTVSPQEDPEFRSAESAFQFVPGMESGGLHWVGDSVELFVDPDPMLRP